MENTIENKVKFITQYWGQKVLKVVPTTTEIVGVGWNLKSPNMYVALKSLMDISDEDAMGIAIMCGWKEYDAHNSRHILLQKGRGIMEDYANDADRDYGQQLTDFLRSKGYLLPFHDLTTEQIIEYGWAKIIK